MILLLSQAETEYTTNEVIDWLLHLGGDFVRVNGRDLQTGHQRLSLSDESTDYQLWINDQEVDFDDVNIVWYRRWSNYMEKVNIPGEEEMADDLNKHRKREFKTLSRSFFSLLEGKKWLSRPLVLRKKDWTKFDVLRLAKKAGLNIPDSIVVSQKKDLIPFIKKHKKVITKPISEGGSFPIGDNRYATYTSKVEQKDLDNFTDYFFPTLFQELLEKEIELRIFYFDEECHSMAIFSGLDEQTSVDFRRYNFQHPARMVPYKLPKEIIEKLTMLMHEVGLDNGSVDLIKTKDGRFVFLEINPVGQFGMVSRPCQYFLEKKVAQYLIRKDQKSPTHD